MNRSRMFCNELRCITYVERLEILQAVLFVQPKFNLLEMHEVLILFFFFVKFISFENLSFNNWLSYSRYVQFFSVISFSFSLLIWLHIYLFS